MERKLITIMLLRLVRHTNPLHTHATQAISALQILHAPILLARHPRCAALIVEGLLAIKISAVRQEEQFNAMGPVRALLPQHHIRLMLPVLLLQIMLEKRMQAPLQMHVRELVALQLLPMQR